MVLVDIYVPAIDRTFDFHLDETVPIFSLLDEIGEMIMQVVQKDLNHGALNGQLMLCSKEERRILPANLSLAECQVKNGSQLLVV